MKHGKGRKITEEATSSEYRHCSQARREIEKNEKVDGTIEEKCWKSILQEA